MNSRASTPWRNNIITKDRTNQRNGAGVALIIRKNINYRPPQEQLTKNKWNNVIKVVNNKGKLVLADDFNAQHHIWHNSLINTAGENPGPPSSTLVNMKPDFNSRLGLLAVPVSLLYVLLSSYSVSHKVCAIFGCRSSKKRMFQFPCPLKDKDRCLQWITASRREDFLQLPPKIVRSKVLCDIHFENRYRLPTNLMRDAVPTCNLPGQRGSEGQRGTSGQRGT
ncbi:uncharacterized protein LOC128884692 isoform X4 [Hylaeus volcanicus]|uniref:uncharacterized protein LOC128884692 isoform X4 n=1 Tax=Hylaeus volcanicus TaxID=313075 RepID=UPI0023B79EC7|nr:uncharacterized protein LOC128884692 isoform X4 [Hylaeus volcanicus]